MRVLILSATPPNIALGSGTHVAAVNLRTGLETLGHEVEFLGPPAWLRSFPPLVSRFLFNWTATPPPGRPFDIICGFDMDGYAMRAPAPYVAYLHGVIADEARFESGLTRRSLDIQARAERTAARRAARVLAPSNYSARRITELYGTDPARIRTVPPGFDLEGWRAELGAAVPETSPGPRVLCVARMYPRKNHGALLRATALLRARIPSIYVRIVGDGPERSRLERLAASLDLHRNVQFLGQVPRRALAVEYVSCDVFCLPTLQEGFGLVFAEAMTAGKPIVALRAGATPEIVGANEGLLAEPGDDAALAGALGRLLGDPEMARGMGSSGRRLAAERLGTRLAAERFIEAVRDLVGGPPLAKFA